LETPKAPKEDDKTISYTGSSLDEITFIEMCRDAGLAHFMEKD